MKHFDFGFDLDTVIPQHWDDESRMWVLDISEEEYKRIVKDYEVERAIADARLNRFDDLEELIEYASRKKDWHKNKGKRRIKDGFKNKYV